jgi:chemotaxis protein methyltransferase CheR
MTHEGVGAPGLGELAGLLEAIHAKYGCDLRGYAPGSLQRRVFVALARSGMGRFCDFQRRILDDPDLFGRFLHDLTVHVSELFRDPGLYRSFRAQVVPLLRTYPQLKIWHAGCATGEEAYASAIVLTEEGLYDRSQIYATDLSAEVLADAQEGVYSMARFRTFEANYRAAGGRAVLANYFNVAHGRVVAKQALKRNILFFQHNLVSDASFGEMHVVFCRNVLIYFGRQLREHVLTQLTRSLCRGGFLCLGESERLSRADAGGHFSAWADAEHIYRHTGDAR